MGDTGEDAPTGDAPPEEVPAAEPAAEPATEPAPEPEAQPIAEPEPVAEEPAAKPEAEPHPEPAQEHAEEPPPKPKEESHAEEEPVTSAPPAEGEHAKEEAPAEQPELEKQEKVPSKETIDTERKTSEPAVHKVESKGAAQEKPSVEAKAQEKEKDSGSEQRSLHDVSQQRSSKLSIKSMSSLSKRQSKEDSKEMFARRKSTRSIKNAVGSIVSFRRGSIAECLDRQKTAKFMNTYKLDSDNPFNVERVTKILEEVLVEALENLTYDVDKVPKQAKWASSAIRAKLKEQEYDRYKLICLVTIGEKRSQDMYSTYRFLWDVDRDKHASFVHENMSVFAIACCFGIYYE